MKKETEVLLTSAQDQAFRTNYIRNMIDKQDVSPMCHLCGEREETVSHIVTECKKLAQKQYKNSDTIRHNQVVHWKLCQNYDLQCNENWYDHSPEAAIENDQVKLLRDFSIQTDHHLDHNRPDTVVLEKASRVCQIIHVACSFEIQIVEKETREDRPLPGFKS